VCHSIFLKYSIPQCLLYILVKMPPHMQNFCLYLYLRYKGTQVSIDYSNR